MLNLIATDLNISIPAAGSLVTINALGLAIGGPILTALTIKLNKRAILIGALVLFILANLVLVLTTSFGLSVAARTLAGALQGLFIAAGFVVGMAIVPPERMGRASTRLLRVWRRRSNARARASAQGQSVIIERARLPMSRRS